MPPSSMESTTAITLGFKRLELFTNTLHHHGVRHENSFPCGCLHTIAAKISRLQLVDNKSSITNSVSWCIGPINWGMGELCEVR